MSAGISVLHLPWVLSPFSVWMCYGGNVRQWGGEAGVQQMSHFFISSPEGLLQTAALITRDQAWFPLQIPE